MQYILRIHAKVYSDGKEKEDNKIKKTTVSIDPALASLASFVFGAGPTKLVQAAIVSLHDYPLDDFGFSESESELIKFFRVNDDELRRAILAGRSLSRSVQAVFFCAVVKEIFRRASSGEEETFLKDAMYSIVSAYRGITDIGRAFYEMRCELDQAEYEERDERDEHDKKSTSV